MIGKYIGYNYTTVAGSPYGGHWRNLRSICGLEILCTNCLNNFQPIRQHEIKVLAHRVFHKSGDSPFELKSKLFQMSYNIIMRMVAGKRYYGEEVDSEEAHHFRKLMEEVNSYGGASNPADFVPAIFLLFSRSTENKLAKLSKKMDALLQGLVDEHRRDKSWNTMIDHLLSLQESEPEYYTDQIIKGIVLVSFLLDSMLIENLCHLKGPIFSLYIVSVPHLCSLSHFLSYCLLFLNLCATFNCRNITINSQ
uniref:Cytochrome P450 n=1 Tax=Solanum tuberosum TaxID=4113 RepID=M1CBY3_SOLTU